MIESLNVFKKPNFFNGLKAASNFWNEMLDYFTFKENFYNLSLHGYGVVPNVLDEFKITSVKKSSNLLLIVGRGAAVDYNGKAMFLYHPQTVLIDYKKYNLPETVYITIKYNEVYDDYYIDNENPEYHGYKKRVESAQIDISNEEPEKNNIIELARIYLKEDENKDIKAITEPKDYSNPQVNEIDTRFVPWICGAKKTVSPILKKFLTDLLNETNIIANHTDDIINLTCLKELKLVSLIAKMIVQCGELLFSDIINIFNPIYEINNQLIQQMLDFEIKNEKRLYSIKNNFGIFRTKVHEMGDLVKYFDDKLETINKIIKVQKDILECLRNILVFKKTTFDDLFIISYDLPGFLVIEDEKYSLVEYLDFNDYETEKIHEFKKENIKDYSTSKSSFCYPDSVMVNDTLKRYAGGKISFKIRNLVKNRDLLMIRRTDVFHGNYKVQIFLNDQKVKTLNIDCRDTKCRWRNIICLFEEKLIIDDSIKISFEVTDTDNDNFGKIWFYQKI
ncbi:MAG: hypothetical protein JXB50_09140 [Spirochaetes bacterium]|nr:hypothetical protein [Spirochaetota bacterium]